MIPSIFVQTNQHTKIRDELLRALGRPEPKPSLRSCLLKAPLVVVSATLMFVVTYLSIWAIAVLVVVGIILLLTKLFGE